MHSPDYHKGEIYNCQRPIPIKDCSSSTSSEIITRCRSEEYSIPEIQIHELNQPVKSADMIDEHGTNDILPLSLQLLADISPHRDELNPLIIRNLLSIFSSYNQEELEQSTTRIKEYIKSNDIAYIRRIHIP